MGPVQEVSTVLDEARSAYRRRDWALARDRFGAAAAEGPLGAQDAYQLASCHWWLGELDQALPALAAAYRLFLDAGLDRTAALVALEAGYTHALRGDGAQASGWTARAARHLDNETDCGEKAYLDYLALEDALGQRDLDRALELALHLVATGKRFGDPNLVALGVLGQGEVMVRRGEVARGLSLLDEAMVAAVSDDLDPGWAGNIYCHLMQACDDLYDWGRAAEWTAATARWCEAMPGAGPFMGICRVHRARVQGVRGEWDQAEAALALVCQELAHFLPAMVAEAHYCLGDLRRQRGDLEGAAASYAQAHSLGRDPCPGLALLWLAQGRTGAARASLRRALDGAGTDTLSRARLLPAAVEVALAASDVEMARSAADELAAAARLYGTTGLRAEAATATGAVLLDQGDAAAALVSLGEALRGWIELGAGGQTARLRLLLARAHEALGEAEAGELEARAARAELERLGVAPPRSRPGPRADGLSPREAEILDLVADGLTNQDIAQHLVLSIRTVERHLATVYRKLGLEGRSARAAAVRHALSGNPAEPR